MRYLIIGLLLFSSFAFSADKNNYDSRFLSILEHSQNVGKNDATAIDRVDSQWQLFMQDYPLDKNIANNYAVFLIEVGLYTKAQNILEKALRYDSDTELLIDNLNQVHAFQAQKVYKQLFDETEVILPVGKWAGASENAVKEIKVAKVESKKSETDKVRNRLENWRASWTSQDLEGYLSFYKDGYFSHKFKTNQSWRASRKRSLRNPKFINIKITNLKIRSLGKGIVQTYFLQDYYSNRFKDKIGKKIIWKLIDGEWRIINERVVYK